MDYYRPKEWHDTQDHMHFYSFASYPYSRLNVPMQLQMLGDCSIRVSTDCSIRVSGKATVEGHKRSQVGTVEHFVSSPRPFKRLVYDKFSGRGTTYGRGGPTVAA